MSDAPDASSPTTSGFSPATPHLGADRKLKVLTVDPAIEDEIARSIEAPAAGERAASPTAPLLRSVLDGLQRLAGDPTAVASTILLCHSPACFHSRRLLEPFLPRVVVFSLTEIPPGISVQSLGVVR